MSETSWPNFLKGFDWRQGEHVSLIGPTGQGKSTLALAIFPIRRWRLILATKPKDKTFDDLVANGYRIIRRWPPSPDDLKHGRLVLWPRADTMRATTVVQQVHFSAALNDIYTSNNWAVMVDETHWVSQRLGLSEQLATLWQQGRSIGISVVASFQRPAWVPREAVTQATHLFFWQTGDLRDLTTIGGLGAFDPKAIRTKVASLAPHEVLYLNSRTGVMTTTKVDL